MAVIIINLEKLWENVFNYKEREKWIVQHIIIVCRQYIIYPDYGITKADREMFTTKRNERDMKEKRLNELRDMLKSGVNGVKSVIKCYLSLPTEEAHHKTNQTRGAHVMAQRINPDISKKFMNLFSKMESQKSKK